MECLGGLVLAEQHCRTSQGVMGRAAGAAGVASAPRCAPLAFIPSSLCTTGTALRLAAGRPLPPQPASAPRLPACRLASPRQPCACPSRLPCLWRAPCCWLDRPGERAWAPLRAHRVGGWEGGRLGVRGVPAAPPPPSPPFPCDALTQTSLPRPHAAVRTAPAVMAAAPTAAAAAAAAAAPTLAGLTPSTSTRASLGTGACRAPPSTPAGRSTPPSTPATCWAAWRTG